jgi:hypothetical protein
MDVSFLGRKLHIACNIDEKVIRLTGENWDVEWKLMESSSRVLEILVLLMENCEIGKRHWDVRRQSSVEEMLNCVWIIQPLMFREGWTSQQFNCCSSFRGLLHVNDGLIGFASALDGWNIEWARTKDEQKNHGYVCDCCRILRTFSFIYWWILSDISFSLLIESRARKLNEKSRNLLTNFSWCLKWWSYDTSISSLLLWMATTQSDELEA